MGTNLVGFEERIDNLWYTTIRNRRGEPLLIFDRNDVHSVCVKQAQLLWRIHASYYILTFSNSADAKQFNEDVGAKTSQLGTSREDASIQARFDRNQITIDWQN